jgi:hypothetical protein
VEGLGVAVDGTGARRLLLMVEGAGDPERIRSAITRLGSEVIPRLRPVPAT